MLAECIYETEWFYLKWYCFSPVAFRRTPKTTTNRLFEVVVMAQRKSIRISPTTQHFTSQFEGYVWPLPSGLIFAGAPPFSQAV